MDGDQASWKADKLAKAAADKEVLRLYSPHYRAPRKPGHMYAHAVGHHPLCDKMCRCKRLHLAAPFPSRSHPFFCKPALTVHYASWARVDRDNGASTAAARRRQAAEAKMAMWLKAAADKKAAAEAAKKAAGGA